MRHWPLTEDPEKEKETSHCHPRCCIFASNEANRSNRHRAMERMRQHFQTTRVTLTFDHLAWKSVLHIVPSWVVSVVHVTRIGQVGTETWTEQNKIFEWPTWPWSQITHVTLSLTISPGYETNASNSHGAIKQTLQQFRTTRVTLTYDILTWRRVWPIMPWLSSVSVMNIIIGTW